jgi:hypothetical protein
MADVNTEVEQIDSLMDALECRIENLERSLTDRRYRRQLRREIRCGQRLYAWAGSWRAARTEVTHVAVVEPDGPGARQPAAVRPCPLTAQCPRSTGSPSRYACRERGGASPQVRRRRASGWRSCGLPGDGTDRRYQLATANDRRLHSAA